MKSPFDLVEKRSIIEQEVVNSYAVNLFNTIEKAQDNLEPFDNIAAFKIKVSFPIEKDHNTLFSRRAGKGSTTSPLASLRETLDGMLSPFDMVVTHLVRSSDKGEVNENLRSSSEPDDTYSFVCFVGAILPENEEPKESLNITSPLEKVQEVVKGPVFVADETPELTPVLTVSEVQAVVVDDAISIEDEI